MYEISNTTQKAEEFIGKFKGKLDELTKLNDLPPGMLITVMAQMNFLGADMPADVFKRIDYNSGFETPDDPVIIGEVFKRINGGKVVIEKPCRSNVGGLHIQYNFVREYRPKRGARRTDVPLNLPFDSSKFNYSLEVCGPGKFDSVNHGDLSIDFLFNRYPFAPYHFLWIPDGKKGQHGQYLDSQKDSNIIDAMWHFVSKSGLGENIRLGYNSNGAHASVNHLHFQGFFVTDDWEPPIERFIRMSNSSGPLDCYFPGAVWMPNFEGTAGLKAFISEMNDRYEREKDLAYNLYVTPKGIACFPRKAQGNPDYFAFLEKSPFTTGYAFFEMAGEIVSPTKDISVFDSKIEERILRLYDALSLNGRGNK